MGTFMCTGRQWERNPLLRSGRGYEEAAAPRRAQRLIPFGFSYQKQQRIAAFTDWFTCLLRASSV